MGGLNFQLQKHSNWGIEISILGFLTCFSDKVLGCPTVMVAPRDLVEMAQRRWCWDLLAWLLTHNGAGGAPRVMVGNSRAVGSRMTSQAPTQRPALGRWPEP